MNQNLIESCMESCLACAVACRKSAELFRGTRDTDQCVQSCLDCANHCVICASDLRDKSPLLTHSLRMCAFACEICADECLRHEADHIKRCEEECRVCAAKCREVRRAIGEMEIRRREA
jgi:hypothetical protein